MHPIDVAYKRTMDEIGERLSKVKEEVDEIELLATTKIATLYDGKIAALRASAATMQSQVNELKALIGEDCGAPGGENTAASEEVDKPVTTSEWNSLARQSNAEVSQVDGPLIPLCGADNQSIPHFPSTAFELTEIPYNRVIAILKALGLTPMTDVCYDLGQLAARIGISEGLWCQLGFSAKYLLRYKLPES